MEKNQQMNSLPLFKKIIKVVFKIKNELNRGEHAPKIKKLLNGDEIYKYVTERAKKEFKTSSRQFKNQTITEEQLNEKIESCKYILRGLNTIFDDLSLKSNKRVALQKNEFIPILNAGIKNWGNIKYHEKLIESFITIAKYSEKDLKDKSKN